MKKLNFIFLILLLCIPVTAADEPVTGSIQAGKITRGSEKISGGLDSGSIYLNTLGDKDLFRLSDAGINKQEVLWHEFPSDGGEKFTNRLPVKRSQSDTVNSSRIIFMILLTVGILGFVGIRRKRP